MRPENFILKYLDEAQLMQVAVSTAEGPWVCTVYFAVDNAHNLYWLSKPGRKHSLAIADDPAVAGTIVPANTYGQPVRGVQFSGTAREVPADELEALFEAYAERFVVHDRLQKLLTGEDQHRLYQIAPDRFVLFDELNFSDNPRQEWRP